MPETWKRIGRQDPGQAWETYGQEDAYFGVLSDERFSGGQLDADARAAFFASGREAITEVLGDARRAFDPDFAPRTSLDFGCGVGRLLLPLAEVSEAVVGVDVSPSMRAEAARNLSAAGHRDVTLIGPEELAGLRGKVDFVHSLIVLQHIPTPEGMRLIDQLLRALCVGGIAALHVTTRPPTRKAVLYWAAMRRVPFAHNLWNLVKRRPWGHPQMQMNPYRLDRLVELAAAQHCGPVLVKHVPAETPSDWNGAYVLVRRYAD